MPESANADSGFVYFSMLGRGRRRKFPPAAKALMRSRPTEPAPRGRIRLHKIRSTAPPGPARPRGTRMPRVRVSPLGPKCYKALLRFIAFFVCMERDSKNQITICRWHIAATSANTGGYLYLRLRCKCKRVSPLGPKVQNPLLRSLGFFSSLHKNSLSEKSYLVAVLCATRILLLRDSRKRDHLVVK